MGMRYIGSNRLTDEEKTGCLWALGIITFFILVGLGGVEFLLFLAGLMMLLASLILQKM